MTLRVVIVEDSIVLQQAIVGLCEEDEELEVVAVAGMGETGIAKVIELRPSVVILDIGLPDIDGFDVVRQIMAKVPTPILIFTATLKPTWRRSAFDALSLGAIDVMLKPEGKELADPAWRASFRTQLKLIARSPVIPHVFSTVRKARRRERAAETHAAPQLLVVAGSAGSPKAVSAMLRELKPIFPLPLPVIVALHLGRGMGAALARHLAGVLDYPAVEIGEFEQLRPGCIYVVPGGHHAELRGHHVAHTFLELPGAAFAPSLDHLLTSVGEALGPRAIAVILSGMGEDGAAGMLRLRRAGGRTLGQDEQTSLVYGMPRVAANLGALEAQDSPPGLGQLLLEWIRPTRGEPRTM